MQNPDDTINRVNKRYKRCKNTGFSLLEIIVVVVIISILFGLAIDHLFKWRISAEKAGVQKLVSQMRSAISLQVTKYYVKGRLGDVLNLVGTNPLVYVIELPSTYSGEFKRPDLNTLQPGNWLYDTSKKILIYRVRYPKNFTTKLAGIKRIELKVSLVYDDINKNKQFNRDVDTIEGLRLTSSAGYSWLLSE